MRRESNKPLMFVFSLSDMGKNCSSTGFYGKANGEVDRLKARLVAKEYT